MNPIIERVKEIAAELQALCPGNVSVTLAVSQYASDTKASVELVLHGHPTYAAAVEEMRRLGVKVRTKQPHVGEMIYTTLSGDSDGVKVVTYPDELPPSCRLEKVIEKIPKQQTVDTGEFIEVERQKVVCGRPMEAV